MSYVARIARNPVTDNPPLERYRQLLLACAEGKAQVPLDHALEDLCEAAGRTPAIFKRTLEWATLRFRESQIQNYRRSSNSLRRTADPRLAKEQEKLHAQMSALNSSKEQLLADIRVRETFPAKITRYRQEFMELMTGGTVAYDGRGWPEWLKGQHLSSKNVVTFADIDADQVESVIQALEERQAEIPVLRHQLENQGKETYALSARYNELEQLKLEWDYFIF